MSLDSLNNIPRVINHSVVNSNSKWDGLGVQTILIFLAIGGLIFGFFYLLKRYVLPLLKLGKRITKTKLLAFRVEVATWLVFALFALTQFFTQSLFVTSALLFVIGLIGFHFWKDFFPGLLLRVSNKFKINDLVRFEDNSGKLKKLGVTSVHIKTEDEELIFVPYHKLSNGLFVKRQAKGKLISSKIVLQIGNKDPNQVIDNVANWIHICPWAISQETYNASIQPGGLLNVTVYAADKVSLGKVERFVKKQLEEM